jgi:hypothetical protein
MQRKFEGELRTNLPRTWNQLGTNLEPTWNQLGTNKAALVARQEKE